MMLFIRNSVTNLSASIRHRIESEVNFAGEEVMSRAHWFIRRIELRAVDTRSEWSEGWVGL